MRFFGTLIVLVAWVWLAALLTGCGPERAASRNYEEPAAPEGIPMCPGKNAPQPGECTRVVYRAGWEKGCLESCPWLAQPEPDAEEVAETVAPEPAEMVAMMTVPLTRATLVRLVPSGDQQQDDELLLLTLRVIDRVHLRTGANIEISEAGWPLSIHDGARQGSAAYDKFCFGGGCTPAHGVRVYVSSETLSRIYVDNFADNALAHEFTHVLSGWGHCTDMDTDGHLEPGHIVSNGNTGYGQMSWTDQDTELACSCGACP